MIVAFSIAELILVPELIVGRGPSRRPSSTAAGIVTCPTVLVDDPNHQVVNPSPSKASGDNVAKDSTTPLIPLTSRGRGDCRCQDA